MKAHKQTRLVRVRGAVYLAADYADSAAADAAAKEDGYAGVDRVGPADWTHPTGAAAGFGWIALEEEED